MAFCSSCGRELPDGARFCTFCGTPTPNANTDPRFQGEIKKCPNCGEILNSFEIKCPTCGLELRGVKASSSVKELSDKIQQLEAGRTHGKVSATSKQNVTPTDEQIASLISSFAIPNTREDLLEFFIMASSNIITDMYGLRGSYLTAGQKVISEAWRAKFEQAYNKASVSFGDDPEFTKYEKIYSRKQKEIHNAKMQKAGFYIGTISFMVILLIVLYALGFAYGRL